MSHDLEIVKGVAHMAYTGQAPWHSLGKKVPADLSPEQMLKAANLNWTVEKIPGWVMINGKKSPLNTHALVRSSDHRILSEVSQDWKPMQNIDAFNFFTEYCEAGDMEMNTAGSLRNGEIVWALAKVKDGFILTNGKKKDEVESYLLFVNPHQWARKIEVRFTPTRVVCWNTMSLALSERTKQAVKVGHKKEFDAAKVKEMLGIAHMKLEGYKDRAQQLVVKKYTDELIKEYMKTVFPVYTTNKEKPSQKELSNSAQRALAIVELSPGAKFAPGSWWNAFNACTFHIDHEVGLNDDTRLSSAWFGAGQKRKVVALNKAVEFAETV
jgi:phage/plasmid-like protein (TIGR03299 family)